MGRMSLETRAKIIAIRSRNYSLMKINEHLEGVSISKMAIYLLIKKREHQKKAQTPDSTGKSLPLHQQSNGLEQWSHIQTATLCCGLWISEGIIYSHQYSGKDSFTLRLDFKKDKILCTDNWTEPRKETGKAHIDTNDLEFSDVIGLMNVVCS